MADLSVRKLDKRAYEQLRARAIKHGVSMEEEARQIIYLAVSAPDRLSAVFQKHFGQKNGIDLTIPNQRKPHNPMDFNE
jgi:antitoxin FitA